MSNDESELIAQILAGNYEDFRQLVERHKEGLYRHCFYITHDEDAAEDIAQESFIRAYTKLGQYDSRKGSFKAWLYTIGSHLCTDFLRQQKTLPLDNEESLLSTYATPEQLVDNRELYEALTKLRPKYRAVVTLYYWHGYSYEDIATTMHVPIGTVRGWLNRAKKQLQEVLS